MEHPSYKWNMKGIRMVRPCVYGIVGINCKMSELVELNNVSRLIVFHGISDRVEQR